MFVRIYSRLDFLSKSYVPSVVPIERKGLSKCYFEYKVQKSI